LFGTVPAAVYINIGATFGATQAFLAARGLAGNWIQGSFQEPLQRFNKEMERHGHSYLLILRILPVLPFFLVNYCAGISKIPLRTFVWTTSLGILPGSLVHTFIGRNCGASTRPGISSPGRSSSPWRSWLWWRWFPSCAPICRTGSKTVRPRSLSRTVHCWFLLTEIA